MLRTGTAHSFPDSTETVWAGCLDLVWQFDGIARLSAEERLVVFSRSGGFVRQVKDRAHPQIVDVLMAVAFPRPGPNWYSEHHGTPEISAFVMLVRLRAADSDPRELFQPGGRDLEERWRFFLSGVGGNRGTPRP